MAAESWASLSDYLGRKRTYAVFFSLGALLYAALPSLGRIGSVPMFVACVCLILTMYGGGFATIPAYLADLFGTQFVGAIHGRLLTAWSVAGVLGPVLVNYLRQYQIDRGVPKELAYDLTLYVMSGALVLGLLCNLAIRRVPERHYTTPEHPAAAERQAPVSRAPSSGWGVVALAWMAVAVPLVLGIGSTLKKALRLFA